MLPSPTTTARHRASFRRVPIPGMAFLALFASAMWGSPASATEPGEVAPMFSAPLLDGAGNLALADYRGKIVYLDFWASWCPPCLKSIPDLEKLRLELPEKRFQILAVNLDKNSKKALKFLAKHSVGYPSVSNTAGDIPEKFGLETMPTSYLIDAAGVVRYVHQGYHSGDLDVIRDEVRKIMR